MAGETQAHRAGHGADAGAQPPATLLALLKLDDAVRPGLDGLASWTDLATLMRQPGLIGLYISGATAEQAAQALRAWRASEHWFKPAYLDPSQLADALADGQPDYADALTAAQRIDALRNTLHLLPATLQEEERLLYFSYLREGHLFKPVRQRTSKFLYVYPEAEAIASGSTDVAAQLGNLLRRDLLQTAALVDRTRHCPACDSAHLHYVDSCPRCHSIDIRASESLHCFTCGHVAARENFSASGQLVCPQCAARLRHIGVDYDRPLSKMSCNACQNTFIDSDVLVQCLDCDQQSDTQALRVREVHTLRLSQHGRAALRAGQMHDSFAALDGANFVQPNYFQWFLDWAINSNRRHPEMRFGLLCVHFENAVALVESLGPARAYMVLDEFARRLRELLRNTDMTTRSSESELWIYLSFGNCEGFAARLRTLLRDLEIAEQHAGMHPRLNWRASEDGFADTENARSVMDDLRAT